MASATALPAAVLAEPRQSQEGGGQVFRTAAREFQACLDAQWVIAERRRESALDYADRIHRRCAGSMEAFSTAATIDRPRGDRRVRGAIRGAISDAVLGYDARAAFLD